MHIETLVPDIYKIVQTKGWLTDELGAALSTSLRLRFEKRFGTPEGDAPKPSLRLSRMGPSCPLALWYSIHRPELAEPIPPWAEIKYTYGDILEALAILYAKAAGHEVTGEQDEILLDGIVGHRDCVIDGCVVDVKSTSSRGFEKFKSRGLAFDDPFGYLDQLDGYVVGSLLDPLVKVKDKGYILAIDKTLGKMVLYEHNVRGTILDRIASYKSIVGSPNPPACTCRSIPHGASGNLMLDTRASYSPFKHSCHPTLRTFIYSDGPRYLTKVVRKPDVPEIFTRRTLEKTDLSPSSHQHMVS